ncbi:maleylacetoacetate isomerase [Sphingobium yanoikuyae]|uniref:maleylacetoacetate isomerase n=1 Tax=Sphingobium yanoikuyae TaxID=13690 RepID=UPI000846BD65|nr:maleylacetoacetate isomerase [Sphingobium yanoikuyae]
MLLHGYFRSTASYRVRIALNLKGVSYEDAFHHLRRGEQNAPEYLKLNPQGLLPTLEIGDAVLTQSLAICEYLEDKYPEPAILPADLMERAHVRAFAQVIACDIHPVQNLKILARLRALGIAEDDVNAWARTAIEEGLAACDALIAGTDTPFCFGQAPSLADICLVPQLVNARRFGVDLKWERLLAIEARCLALESFAKASPDRQPDAE